MAQVTVYTTQIQYGQSVQLLNVKLVDASRNQKVNQPDENPAHGTGIYGKPVNIPTSF
jgi:hypothetical protein